MSVVPTAEPWSEADAKLLESCRAKLLGLAAETPPEAASAPPANSAVQDKKLRRQKQARNLFIIFGAIGLVLIVLSWLLPQAGEDLKAFGTFLVTISTLMLGIIYLAERQAAAKLLTATPQAPTQSRAAWRKLLISLGWFLLLGILVFEPSELAWLIGTLLLHEAGHFFGMRHFGYRDVQMFFIPLFGAAVKGEKKGVPAWQEAVVLLLGPLPGLLLGCGIYFLDRLTPLPYLRTGAEFLVTINFLNLLPLGPLDGGRLFNRLVASRYAWLEAAIIVPAATALAFLCLDPGWICLSLTAVAALMLVPAFYKTARAGASLQARWPDLPTELAGLSEQQWRDLFVTTRTAFGDKNLEVQMKSVHARALQRPAPALVTAGFLAVHMAGIILALVTASVTQLRDDAGQWPARLRLSRQAAMGNAFGSRAVSYNPPRHIGVGFSSDF
jgi:Zn-dependent protease